MTQYRVGEPAYMQSQTLHSTAKLREILLREGHVATSTVFKEFTLAFDAEDPSPPGISRRADPQDDQENYLEYPDEAPECVVCSDRLTQQLTPSFLNADGTVSYICPVDFLRMNVDFLSNTAYKPPAWGLESIMFSKQALDIMRRGMYMIGAIDNLQENVPFSKFL